MKDTSTEEEKMKTKNMVTGDHKYNLYLASQYFYVSCLITPGPRNGAI